MAKKFTHGQAVTLTDASGVESRGTLHLPDVVMYGPQGQYTLPRETSGGYGVHTIRKEDGSLFRTEGRVP